MVNPERGVPGGSANGGNPPLSWRVPPYQSALLMLLTSGFAAWAIYGHPSAGATGILAVLAVTCFVLALLTLRMHLIVDDDGVAVRLLRRESWTGWRDIQAVTVVSGVRGAQTLRIQRVDRTHVDVPPSLLMSSRPVTKPKAEAMLRAVAAQVSARRTAAPRQG